MHPVVDDPKSKALRYIGASVLLFILAVMLPPYRLFEERQASMLELHLLLELFSVIVCVLVAAVSWYSFDHEERAETGLLAAGFLSVAVLDLAHALSYDGMSRFVTDNSTPKAIFFWLAGRSFAVVTILLVALDLRLIRGRLPWVLGFAMAAITALWFGLFHADAFPLTFIAGHGVTPFKSAFEYLLCASDLLIAVLFWRNATPRNADRFYPLAAASIIMGFGELVFAHYRAPTDFLNTFGHSFKVASYALVFQSLFVSGMRRPFLRQLETEEALRNSEARLRTLGDNLPDSYVYQYTRDSAGKPHFLFLSAGVEKLHGISPASAMKDANLLFSLIDSAQEQALREAELRSAATLGDFSVDLRVRVPQGGWRWLQIRSRPLRDAAGNLLWDGVATDITERKRIAAALEESRTRLAGIIDSAMDAVITITSDRRIVVFNAAAEHMFQYRAAEMIGEEIDRLIPPRFREGHAAQITDFGDTGRTNRPMGAFGGIFGLRANGEEFPIDAAISQVTAGGQRLYSIILRDTSAARQAEATRLQLEAQLRQMQKMDALGTLAGGVAHDFNNILATIDGCAELASHELAADHPARAPLASLRTANRRGRDLVRRILMFSRRQQPQRAPLDIAAVVEEAVRLLRATLPAQVAMELTSAANLPSAVADRTEIEQIVINLCTNAWQAMGEGGGQVRIRVECIDVDDTLPDRPLNLLAGSYIRLTVADNGPGMSRETQARIFEPFFTTKPVGTGTGLGLAVVHGIVSGCGGAVSVSSEPGQGATFFVYLPANAMPVTAEVGQPAREVPHGTGQEILYVDDEESLVYIADRLLSRLGYRVSGFTEPEQALAALRRDPQRFDLVVLDYNMPGKSGIEVATEILRLRPELPVILVSGFVSDELREQALRLGVREVMYKPDTVQELAATIHGLLSRPHGVA